MKEILTYLVIFVCSYSFTGCKFLSRKSGEQSQALVDVDKISVQRKEIYSSIPIDQMSHRIYENKFILFQDVIKNETTNAVNIQVEFIPSKEIRADQVLGVTQYRPERGDNNAFYAKLSGWEPYRSLGYIELDRVELVRENKLIKSYPLNQRLSSFSFEIQPGEVIELNWMTRVSARIQMCVPSQVPEYRYCHTPHSSGDDSENCTSRGQIERRWAVIGMKLKGEFYSKISVSNFDPNLSIQALKEIHEEIDQTMGVHPEGVQNSMACLGWYAL